MAILVNPDTKVIVQGITGSFGGRHTQLSLEYGSQIVAGVTPGKSGQVFEEKVPIFDSVKEATKESGASASAIFVPPPFAADAILEAVDAGLELVVAITEGIPVRDMIEVKAALQGSPTRLIGPNCPGVVTPGAGDNSHGGCRIGISPGYIHKSGDIGVVSRSGTLTYEAVWQLTCNGLGQSTCVGIGGDPVPGSTHLDIIKLFNDDPETRGIIMIGEIGGSAEEEAAAWIKDNCKKPIAGFIAGKTAPPGRTMGHAGAIVSGGSGDADSKVKVMSQSGYVMSDSPAGLGKAVLRAIQEWK